MGVLGLWWMLHVCSFARPPFTSLDPIANNRVAFLAISSFDDERKERERNFNIFFCCCLYYSWYFDRSRRKKASFQYYLCASIPLLIFMRMFRYTYFPTKFKRKGNICEFGNDVKFSDINKSLEGFVTRFLRGSCEIFMTASYKTCEKFLIISQIAEFIVLKLICYATFLHPTIAMKEDREKERKKRRSYERIILGYIMILLYEL